MGTPSRFCRVKYDSDATLERMIANSSLIAPTIRQIGGKIDPVDFLQSTIRIGDGILLATFDIDTGEAKVAAIGYAKNERPASIVDWFRVSLTLRPNPQGGVAQWKKEVCFRFDEKPAHAYELAEKFARYAKHSAASASDAMGVGTGNVTAPEGVESAQRIEENISSFSRDITVRAWTLKNARGICEGCGSFAPFRLDDGSPFLEIHHVRPLSDGGSDKITNTVALCPNCHRRLHFSDDRIDFTSHIYRIVSRLVPE